MEKTLSIVDICRREMLSADIIPLQAKIDVLQEMREYSKSEYENKLNELYRQINKLRDEYFEI
jgi:homoserine trans-succinylase